MADDARPNREDFRDFEVDCTVTPTGSPSYTAKVIYLPKGDDDDVVEGPLLAFWNAEAPGIGQGTVIGITAGEPYDGTYRVARVHRNDGEVTKYAVTRG